MYIYISCTHKKSYYICCHGAFDILLYLGIFLFNGVYHNLTIYGQLMLTVKIIFKNTFAKRIIEITYEKHIRICKCVWPA